MRPAESRCCPLTEEQVDKNYAAPATNRVVHEKQKAWLLTLACVVVLVWGRLQLHLACSFFIFSRLGAGICSACLFVSQRSDACVDSVH
jgi:hypothetical protein